MNARSVPQPDDMLALDPARSGQQARAMAAQRLLAHRDSISHGRVFADATEIIRANRDDHESWIDCEEPAGSSGC